MDTRLLGEPGDFSGAQDAWRDWSAVFRVYAGAAVPRLQKLNDGSSNADPQRHDPGGRRSGSVGKALLDDAHDLQGSSSEHRCFWRGDSESLEASRQLTEKNEPKMRTRFAEQLMSILSFSLQNDATERIAAWEPEIATYERDSGKVLDDKIKIGTFLFRLPKSQLKTYLLLRFDTMKKWTDFRDEVVAISRAISTAQTQPTPTDVGAMSKGTRSNCGKGAKRSIQTQQACPKCGNTDHTTTNCPVTWEARVDFLEQRSLRQREAARRAREARVQAQSKRVGIDVRTGT